MILALAVLVVVGVFVWTFREVQRERHGGFRARLSGNQPEASTAYAILHAEERLALPPGRES